MRKTWLLLMYAAPMLGLSQARSLAELATPRTPDPILPVVSIDFPETDAFDWGWSSTEVHQDSIDLSLSMDTFMLHIVDPRHKHFVLPHNGEVRSHFGWRGSRYHYGVDLKLNRGDTVYAAFDGKVRYARYNYGGYGNLVVLRHYNNAETYYAHLSRFLVDTNAYVKAGDPIALGGSTGRSTGPHLHFEYRILGNPVDPETIIDFESGDLHASHMEVHSDVFAYRKEMRARKYHRVRGGDTLSALARRYHTSVSAICRLNGISSTSVIRIGQNLRVR